MTFLPDPWLSTWLVADLLLIAGSATLYMLRAPIQLPRDRMLLAAALQIAALTCIAVATFLPASRSVTSLLAIVAVNLSFVVATPRDSAPGPRTLSVTAIVATLAGVVLWLLRWSGTLPLLAGGTIFAGGAFIISLARPAADSSGSAWTIPARR